MTTDTMVIFKLTYPDGWEERWSVREGATSESLIACALSMLDLAGCQYVVNVRAPELARDMSHTPPQAEPQNAATDTAIEDTIVTDSVIEDSPPEKPQPRAARRRERKKTQSE